MLLSVRFHHRAVGPSKSHGEQLLPLRLRYLHSYLKYESQSSPTLAPLRSAEYPVINCFRPFRQVQSILTLFLLPRLECYLEWMPVQLYCIACCTPYSVWFKISHKPALLLPSARQRGRKEDNAATVSSPETSNR